MIRGFSRTVLPFSAGLILVSLIFIVANVQAEDGAGTIHLNGLFWGDGDYQHYIFKSTSEPAGEGYLYVKPAGPGQLLVLARVGYTANDNAFSPNMRNQDGYLTSVGWKNPHDMSRLIGSDHLEIWLECGTGDPAPRWTWTQDLLYDADEGPGYDWRSDLNGPDGLPVTSPTKNDIPPGGIVISSYSSLEYNLENSSWISDQIAAKPNNPEYWMSPDLDPLGTISMTSPITDVNAISGIHEDYPFYMSTGDDPEDLYEWEISYEMLLDVSFCGDELLFVGVSSAHNSPPKSGSEDILIPTAIKLSAYSADGGTRPIIPILVVLGIAIVVSVATLVISHRTSNSSTKQLT